MYVHRLHLHVRKRIDEDRECLSFSTIQIDLLIYFGTFGYNTFCISKRFVYTKYREYWCYRIIPIFGILLENIKCTEDTTSFNDTTIIRMLLNVRSIHIGFKIEYRKRPFDRVSIRILWDLSCPSTYLLSLGN